jgi:bifunctional non-homologous end joining protein LigD
MGLREYQRKRHFQRTPEPMGTPAPSGGNAFVIQKHHATNLHYDFRLELDGVLKSWAVPKGPSRDPAVKRLAMHVEDHPVEYGAFEGIIPKGEYGGGTVMLWDRGTWTPRGDAHEGYREGKLKFELQGEKLRGGWMLVRTGRPANGEKNQRQWLLFKERDNEARPGEGSAVTEELTQSVSTGRTLEEIAADQDWVWNTKPRDGDGPPANHRKTKRAPARKRSAPSLGVLHEYDAKAKQLSGVRLTSPDKVLYPEQNITKLDLAHYYEAVANWMLPHLKDRPLVLVRCPEGRAKACFFQKHPRPGTPDALRQIPIHEEGKTEQYVVVDDVAGLISLAQIGSLEVHTWGARADKLEKPDRLIFDLDPHPDLPWSRVVQSARQMRQFLQELGLESFVKTTGGKGLHLVVPIDRRHDWEEAKAFCKRVAELIVAADPTRYTSNMSKAARPGKIFIDYLRNSRGATAIAPYSTRARPGATVATPLAWDELSVRTQSDRFTLRDMPKRLASLTRDPWEEMASLRQGLAGPIGKVRDFSAVS